MGVPSIESRRGDAVSDIDELLRSAAALRAELRVFETGLRRVRGYLDRGTSASDLHEALDIATARETLSEVATTFQAARHTSRLSVFRLQAAEGMSIAEIARAWGLSRQLVSRMMKDGTAGPTGTS